MRVRVVCLPPPGTSIASDYRTSAQDAHVYAVGEEGRLQELEGVTGVRFEVQAGGYPTAHVDFVGAEIVADADVVAPGSADATADGHNGFRDLLAAIDKEMARAILPVSAVDPAPGGSTVSYPREWFDGRAGDPATGQGEASPEDPPEQ